MNDNRWSAVDRYFDGLFAPSDSALDHALAASAAAGLPAHQVSPTQGKLLFLLAKICGARAMLEIGTLGGYSTIWLARALPAGGRLMTLEIDSHRAELARANVERAGLGGLVEIRLGPALETLPQIRTQGHGPFDFIFIDADKANNPGYLDWALELSRPGSVIVADNVVRDGTVLDKESGDATIRGIRRFNEMLASDARVIATAIQTVGVKGYDGFAIAVVQG